jgi:hypothetical protein
MFWKKLLTFLKNWSVVSILFAPLFILYNINLSDNTADNYNTYKDIVELLSWIFAGIMSLVTFSTLFIAFTYENKLIVASRNLKSFLKPYTLTTDDLRNIIINYENSLNEDKILKIIFIFFVIIAFFATLTWGAAVGLYTNFNLSFKLDLSLGSLLVFGIYSFYAILYFVMILLTIAIKLILLNKDPFERGYLPSSVLMCDVKHLINNKADINEFFMKNNFSLLFYKDPTPKKSNYEVILNLPINISNLRFAIKFYTEKNENLVTFYGKTKNTILNEEIGKSYSKVVSTSFSEEIYSNLNSGNCYAVCKIYDTNYQTIARYLITEMQKSNNHIEFSITKKIGEQVGKDFDGNLIKMKESEKDFCEYHIEKGEIE